MRSVKRADILAAAGDLQSVTRHRPINGPIKRGVKCSVFDNDGIKIIIPKLYVISF